MQTMLRAGADKVSINSAALAAPELIRGGAEKFGSQCVVVSIDAKRVGHDRWEVFSHGGRKPTGLGAVEWATQAVSLGAGEIVLNSIDADGTKAGFDLVITRRISESVGVPVVASGGGGALQHIGGGLLGGKGGGRACAHLLFFWGLSRCPGQGLPRFPGNPGRRVASEAVKLGGSGAKVILITRDTSLFRNPALDTIIQAFRETVAQAGVPIALTHSIKIDPLRVTAVPPGDFLQILKKAASSDVVVSFLGPPVLSDDQVAGVGGEGPPVVAGLSGGRGGRRHL